LSGGARAEGNGVGFGAHADPMESRPSVRDVRAQGVAKGQTSGARGDDHRLGFEVLARESDSAETGNSVVAVPTPHGSSGDPGECARFEVVERSKREHR